MKKPNTSRPSASSRFFFWAILFGIVAIVVIGASIYNIHLSGEQSKTYKHGIGVTGTVTSIRETASLTRGGGGTYYTVKYTYTTTDQHQESSLANLNGSAVNGLHAGSTLTIIYNADDPRQSMPAANMPDSNGTYGLLFFGFVLAVISGVLLLTDRRKRAA